jgi:hypothetical protein
MMTEAEGLFKAMRRVFLEKLPACRGEGSVVGLQLRVRVVLVVLLAVLGTETLALQCVF